MATSADPATSISGKGVPNEAATSAFRPGGQPVAPSHQRARRPTSDEGSLIRRAIRRVSRVWRSSLGFRVVTITMVLGLLVLTALGTYLYGSVAQGLVDGRKTIAEADSLRQAQDVQRTFIWTDKRNNEAELSKTFSDIVKAKQVIEGSERRYVVLSRAVGNQDSVVIPTKVGGPANLSTFIPEDLRAALSATPDRQATVVTTIEENGRSLSAVVVGTRIAASVAGPYDLFFIYPMDRERDIIEQLGRAFLLGGAALILLIGAIALVVTRLAVDPVRRAAEVAQRIADGDLNERITVKGEDDLARLGTSFNAMAASIQQQIAQLENLSRVQQRFVSDVSHELRTPLTTIRMAGDLIHDARHDFPPSVSRSAELLSGEVDRFESLLADLLEISRFDAGAAALELEATDLRGCVDRVVQSLQTLAQAKGSVVRVDHRGGPAVAEVDSRRIERILRNLVSNAIEHGEGRPVEIALAGNDSAVAITVRDHGVGLRPGEAGLVFTRFWRADPARARTTGGTGLGLAISMEDARLHSGRLEAWGSPGAGACFRLTIPRRADATITVSPLPLNPLADAALRGPNAARTDDDGPGSDAATQTEAGG